MRTQVTNRDGLHLFNIDLHVSVIADLRDILARWGHRITDWTLSDHSWVFGRQRDPIDVVNRDTWQNLNPEMCSAFYRRYRDELAPYDGFVVTHTPAFALLFIEWGKPIIVVNTTRYEQPFTLREPDWLWLDEKLIEGVRRKQIRIVSNNKADQAYLEEHSGLRSDHIPSLCAYTGTSYRGRQRSFLMQSRVRDWEHALPSGLRRRLVLQRDAFRHWGWLRRRAYSWQELYDFRGIIHLPYQISTMSIFEQYSANVPLFFPSPRFLLDLHLAHPREVLSDLSFFQIHGVPFHHEGLNRTQDPDVVRRWIELADYNDPENMPHVQHFDSFEHLAEMLNTVDTDEVSRQMAAFNRQRQERILAAWRILLGETFDSRMDGETLRRRP